MAGRLGAHVSRLCGDCVQHVQPAADKVEAGPSRAEAKSHRLPPFQFLLP